MDNTCTHRALLHSVRSWSRPVTPGVQRPENRDSAPYDSLNCAEPLPGQAQRPPPSVSRGRPETLKGLSQCNLIKIHGDKNTRSRTPCHPARGEGRPHPGAPSALPGPTPALQLLGPRCTRPPVWLPRNPPDPRNPHSSLPLSPPPAPPAVSTGPGHPTSQHTQPPAPSPQRVHSRSSGRSIGQQPRRGRRGPPRACAEVGGAGSRPAAGGQLVQVLRPTQERRRKASLT
ncbi:unnamed protein product [Rangifer tarandus platyrhynchus]|uniref:Uncharacterized protein n=2 Tax=Rangifer tarandus platyrhynchus TaxID=3082113 RepID=A0ACB0EGJ8_RANTA|nr:unnamed protein product [Rangifer tarandus platyrhynchus]CAI9699701.1 unnamed protein product [Rangifer tarandus platyrhynchus]